MTESCILVDAFKKKHSLKSLGMPVYLGSGSYELASSQTKYRFIVMEKFGNDVDKLRKTKELSGQTVFQIASQIVRFDFIFIIILKQSMHDNVL